MALIIERTIQAPQDKVWKALTDADLLHQWLPFFIEFKPEVGFETRFELGPDKDHQYTHICRVTKVVEGQKLTYTWRYEGYKGDSLVSFELANDGHATQLKLTHDVLEAFDPIFKSEDFAKGWNYTATALKEFVEK